MKKALLEIDRGCDSRRVRKEKGAGEPLGLHTLSRKWGIEGIITSYAYNHFLYKLGKSDMEIGS